MWRVFYRVKADRETKNLHNNFQKRVFCSYRKSVTCSPSTLENLVSATGEHTSFYETSGHERDTSKAVKKFGKNF